MGALTENFNLFKPDLADAADFRSMNPNWDVIDEQLGNATKLCADLPVQNGGTAINADSTPQDIATARERLDTLLADSDLKNYTRLVPKESKLVFNDFVRLELDKDITEEQIKAIQTARVAHVLVGANWVLCSVGLGPDCYDSSKQVITISGCGIFGNAFKTATDGSDNLTYPKLYVVDIHLQCYSDTSGKVNTVAVFNYSKSVNFGNGDLNGETVYRIDGLNCVKWPGGVYNPIV
jgi:hypothetical protein